MRDIDLEHSLHDIAVNLNRIADALEGIHNCLGAVVDQEKKTLRMVDVDRAKVYSTHLGEKLRKEQAPPGPSEGHNG